MCKSDIVNIRAVFVCHRQSKVMEEYLQIPEDFAKQDGDTLCRTKVGAFLFFFYVALRNYCIKAYKF